MNHWFPRLIFASIVLLSAMNFTTLDGWYLFQSDQFGFKIEFPKEPTENPQVIQSEIGQLKMNIFMYDASKEGLDDNLIYLVNYTEYPDTLVNSEKTEFLDAFFQSSIEGAVNSVNGKLISQERIEIDEYPGREVKIDFGDGTAMIRMKIYLVRNIMYMLQTMTEPEKDFNKSISKFMDSFELLN